MISTEGDSEELSLPHALPLVGHGTYATNHLELRVGGSRDAKEASNIQEGLVVLKL